MPHIAHFLCRHTLGHELQTSSSAGICCAEEEVRGLEHRLGTAHPRVGKAWLQLSRAYQHAGGDANVAKSEQALLRCVLRICLQTPCMCNSWTAVSRLRHLPSMQHGQMTCGSK